MAETRVDVENGSEFAADEVSISHSPLRFVIDFKSITPRVDMNNQQPRLVASHSIIKVEPYLMKELISVLSENVKKFEEKFGPIEKPAALKAAEKDHHHHKKNSTKAKQDYFG